MNAQNLETQANSSTTELIVLENASSEYAEKSTNSGAENMNTNTKNPVLDFVLNVAETAKYVWQRYAEWIIDVSWGKLLLASLLTLIVGGLLSIQSFANWLVIGSLLLKCFIGKEDQVQTNTTETHKPAEQKPDEES
ncbi:hypothetical protein [Undibacterium baiyunense]|uniref:Uncharacterized protein n=1 Tax=Undibacterium baiyunense TaxID=2828731 RepID=A0A941DBV1_9BURK|nr:hypothetical protein [Undibacterium baiyunense]MBR7745829.1 hypothetical protein [Undibacterium baiyunense]